MIFSGKWIFIRFNTDGGAGPDLEDRIEVLLDVIAYHIERIEKEENTDPMEIHYLYYQDADVRREIRVVPSTVDDDEEDEVVIDLVHQVDV